MADKKLTEYKILAVYDDQVDEYVFMEQEATRLMQCGWKPIGTLQIAANGKLYQAFVR